MTSYKRINLAYLHRREDKTRIMKTTRHALVPKLITVLKEGYGLAQLRADVVAGLTVAVVALPLSMALAMASGARPDQGLITAIIGGFIISALGGSRYQIGGPAAAFIVIVLGIINQFGYDGLLLATFMAGLMMIAAGFLRLGTFVKYVPYPVITGFTSGIAAVILISQLKNLLGITFADGVHPHDMVETVSAYVASANTITLPTVSVGLGSLGLMLIIRKYRPRWPIFLIGAVAASVAVFVLKMPVATIGTAFPDLPHSLPAPRLPDMSWARIQALFPSALTIAFLSGVEALLSAVVADGMTGRRHRPNMEFVAQGVANCATALFGGITATGTIARTATNVRAGAHGPIAGMLHSAFLLAFLMVAMPLANFIPLSSLAAILVIVAWNISEVERFAHLLKAPRGERAVLLVTFLLTIFVDLAMAIKVGVIMAALLFMHRMSEQVQVRAGSHEDGEEEDDAAPASEDPLPSRKTLPAGVEVYQINGPFFFGAAGHISDVLSDLRTPPRYLILRMKGVPMMDASGAAALHAVIQKIRSQNGQIILAGIQPQPRKVLEKMGITSGDGHVTITPDFHRALEIAGAA